MGGYKLTSLAWDLAICASEDPGRLSAPVTTAKFIKQSPVEFRPALLPLRSSEGPVLFGDSCLAYICSVASDVEVVASEIVFSIFIEVASYLVCFTLEIEAALGVTCVVIVEHRCTSGAPISRVEMVRLDVVYVVFACHCHSVWRLFKA